MVSASGAKFGKTESGNVWLDPERTSPYKFYQFWVNIDDRDALRYIRFFTMLSRQDIEAIEKQMEQRPQDRAAQLAIAREVTARVHGADAARVAEDVSRLLFQKGDPASLSDQALAVLEKEVPFAEMPELTNVIDGLVALGLAASKGAARRLVDQGGVSINGQRVTDSVGEPLRGRYYLMRKGARDYGLIRLRQS
jgi:tyrosyl-tRNA synthetase